MRFALLVAALALAAPAGLSFAQAPSDVDAKIEAVIARDPLFNAIAHVEPNVVVQVKAALRNYAADAVARRVDSATVDAKLAELATTMGFQHGQPVIDKYLLHADDKALASYMASSTALSRYLIRARPSFCDKVLAGGKAEAADIAPLLARPGDTEFARVHGAWRSAAGLIVATGAGLPARAHAKSADFDVYAAKLAEQDPELVRALEQIDTGRTFGQTPCEAGFRLFERLAAQDPAAGAPLLRFLLEH